MICIFSENLWTYFEYNVIGISNFAQLVTGKINSFSEQFDWWTRVFLSHTRWKTYDWWRGVLLSHTIDERHMTGEWVFCCHILDEGHMTGERVFCCHILDERHMTGERVRTLGYSECAHRQVITSCAERCRVDSWQRLNRFMLYTKRSGYCPWGCG